MNDPAIFSLTGRCATVTGGGQGIGRELALGLARHGADVAVLDIVPEKAEMVADEVRRLGKEGLAYATDVADVDQVESAFSALLQHFERVDILVNCAGLWGPAPALELDLEVWRRVLDVNLTGPFLCSRAAGRHMVEVGRGSIINIASTSAVLGLPGRSAYASSKHGLVGLTKVLASEWGPFGVRVNAIAPGYQQTPMTQAWLNEPGVFEDIVTRLPLRRIGMPEDLVGAAVFLASDGSDYVTGQTLFIEGGLLLT